MSSPRKLKNFSTLQLTQHITANAMGGICLAILLIVLCWSPMVPITVAGITYTLLCGYKQELFLYLPVMNMIITGSLTAASALFGYNLFAIESKKAGNRLDSGNSEHQWCITAVLACNLLAMVFCDVDLSTTFFTSFAFLASGSFLILSMGGPIVKPATEIKFMHHQAGEWICKIVPAAEPIIQASPFAPSDNKDDIEAPAAIKTPETQTSSTVATTTTTIVYNTPPISAGTDTPPMYSAALATISQAETKL